MHRHVTENRGEGCIDVEHRVRFELTRTCVTGLANRRLRPLGYLCKLEPAAGIEPATSGSQVRCSTAELHRRKLERVGGIEPPSPAWKAGALPLSYTRGKGCWPCHSTGRRADRDYQGFGAPPPILVLRFTLLGAGNPRHCPNQHKAATGLRSPSAYGFRCSGNGFVLILPLLPGGRFRALTNHESAHQTPQGYGRKLSESADESSGVPATRPAESAAKRRPTTSPAGSSCRRRGACRYPSLGRTLRRHQAAPSARPAWPAGRLQPAACSCRDR